MRKGPLFVSAAIAATGLIAALPSFGAAPDPVKTRQAAMQENKKAMAEIKAVLDKGGPVTAAAAPARRMAETAGVVPSLFPPGSDIGDTKAKPDIWANTADFTAKAKAFGTAATALAAAADTGDRAAVGQTFAAVAETCKSCHTLYQR